MGHLIKSIERILLITFVYLLSACGGGGNNTTSAPPSTHKDTIAPTISLTGKTSITLTKGSAYIDAGATATDNIDGNITNRIIKGGAVNINVVGVYSITYDVNDNAQNSAVQIKRTVTITATKFSHIKMHYDLLNNQAMIWGELDGIIPIQVTQATSKGSTTLHIMDTSNLVTNQLITYLGTNGNYYVGQIKSIHNIGEIGLFKPIESSINSGVNAWDFYQNGSHANTYGFEAIADFAVKSLKFETNTTGIHLLLGDSWFDEGSIHNRLIQKLPNASIINKGVGGDTTQDLINRFDADVTPNAPDYIWIMSGTNDYWQGVSAAQFKANLNTLINKSKAIGAKVIIIDSSVGEGTAPTTGIKNQFQSEEYVRVVRELNK